MEDSASNLENLATLLIVKSLFTYIKYALLKPDN